MALNSHQYLELYHAAFLGTGVVNPLNLRLAPKELEFTLRDSETTRLLQNQLRSNTKLQVLDPDRPPLNDALEKSLEVALLATLVATAWYVPAAAGAAYVPPASMVPPPLSCTDQVTAVLLLPVTVAVIDRGSGIDPLC